jgi:hypothetical protein
LFWLKIASFGIDALAGTRWAHFNYNDKKAQRLAEEDKLREDRRHDKRRIKHVEKTNNLQCFLSPRWGALGVAATAAMNRSTSRSPAPRGTGPRETTAATVWSWSPPRGADWSSSRRVEAAASGAARPLGCDIARSLPPG